jgi:hypothetical protein
MDAIMTKSLQYLFFCGIAALLPACGQETATSQSTNTNEVKPAMPATMSASKEVASASQTDTADIRLLPENPKSGDCLKAFLTGKKGSMVFQWWINGEELPEQTGNNLCDVELKRDDVVEVLLTGTASRAETTIRNTPPRILKATVGIDAALRQEDIRIDAVTTDVDGDAVELRYEWLVNNEEDLFSTDETLSADRYRKGDRIQIRITPFDGFDEGSRFISQVLTIPNTPPRIVSTPPTEFTDSDYLYPVEAVDPDGDKLSYRLEEAPEGMSIDDAGLVRWNLAAAKRGDYPVKITVEDDDGAKSTQSFSITIAPAPSSPNS